MRKHHIFRPRVSDILESRAVPATLGVATPTGLVGITVTLPSQVPTGSAQVKAAFAAFDQSYINAVDNILLASPSGLLSTSTRSAFNSAIEQSLETLAEQLVLSLGTTSNGSTNSTTSNEVAAAIIGTGSNSLESQLLALSTTTIELSVPTVVSISNGSTQSAESTVVGTAEEVRATNPVPVAQSLDSVTAVPNPGSTSSSSPQASQAVRSAFGNFLNDYFRAVQGVLLAPDANGQVTASANRAAFDAKVSQALKSLDIRLSSTLASSPATSALGPQVRASIDGDGAASLKIQLANLPTPSGPQAATVRDFTLGSTQAIARALALISGDVAKLLAPAGN